MKELSIEEKAKAYDDIIKKANKMHHENCEACQMCIEELIPELKESEDEKIRKGIIRNLEYLMDRAEGFVKDELKERIAWLEKQGEQKSAEFKPSFRVGDVIKPKDPVLGEPRIIKGIHPKFGYDTNNGILDFEFEDNWELVEQKPADKVEPKFHEGDWVVSPNGVYWHIDKISNNRYEVTSNTGESSDWNLDTNIYHKFNIQDAKDGDVLATDNGGICIFDGTVEEGKYPFAYCGVIERVFEICDEELPFTHANVQPATKEQRDILEKTMADAGYTFDFEKKELKKIEQNHAWSEEDKEMLEDTCRILSNSKECTTSNVRWLKSLRPQNTWKPSDEQMEELSVAKDSCFDLSYKTKDALKSLYNDLKKLKG